MNDKILPLYFPGESSAADNKCHLGGVGSRAFTTKVLRVNWREIALRCADVHATSSQVLRALHVMRIPYTPDGRKLTRSNAIGDILGCRHLDLPWEDRSGRKAYFLPAIEMSIEERASFRALTDRAREEAVMNAIRTHGESFRQVEDTIEEGLELIRIAAMKMLEDGEMGSAAIEG